MIRPSALSRRLAGTALLCVAALSVATAAAAQRGTQSGPPRAGRPDTARAPQAFALDFQNQELSVVLSALAEAGNLNVAMSNIPAQRVTVRMARGVPRDTLVAIIRGLAAANSVTFTEQGGLIRLEGDPAMSSANLTAANQAAVAAAQAQAAQANQLRLYTYRLRHASASEVAPVLMNLLGLGTGIVGGQGFIPGQPIQITVPGAGGAAGGRGGGAGAAGGGGAAALQDLAAINQGRGGRGAAQQQVGGGAAGMGGAGGGRGGGGAAQQVLQALAQNPALAALQGAGAGTLTNASAQVRIVAEQSTNSLLIRATPADYQLIQGLLGQIDLRPLQVLIEVTIAEVQRSSDLDVGLGGRATRRGATANAPRDTLAVLPSVASARDFIFQLTGGGGSVNYNAALNALQSRGDVKVLSLPVIIAQNNKEAVLNVGEQRPFVQVNQSVTTGTVPTTVQTVQYIPVGTTLTITPTINPDGYVNMAVDQTNDAATNEVQFSAPVISKRQATTQIFLKDGQTTVIGGLAGNNTSKTVSGVPILSRIPIIGGLFFGNTQRTTTASELFLFLTPHIISSDEDIERLRNSLQGGSELLKDVPIGPRIAPDSLKRPPADTSRRRPPLA